MGGMTTQAYNSTTRPYIEKRHTKGHYYAYLRYKWGGKAVSLGRYDEHSPTALLDAVLRKAEQIDLLSLRKLLAANKTSRDL